MFNVEEKSTYSGGICLRLLGVVLSACCSIGYYRAIKEGGLYIMKCSDCHKEFDPLELNDGQCRCCSIKEIKRWMVQIEASNAMLEMEDMSEDTN